MENIFKKYTPTSLFLAKQTPEQILVSLEESFKLFKSKFNEHYGSIVEEDNLITISSGGWSDNEELISQFKSTFWWLSNFKVHAAGGHYFFDTNRDLENKKKWIVTTTE